MKQRDHEEQDVIVIDDAWSEFVDASAKEGSQGLARDHSFFTKHPRLPVSITATLLTLVVHSLVITPFLLGSPARKHQRPMTEGSAASAQDASSGQFVSQLILINSLHSNTTEEQNDSPYVVAPLNKQQENASRDLAILSSTPQLEIAGSENGADTNAPTTEAIGDAAGRAMLFGRYMGQIKARIERAWVYPTNTALVSFRCTAQIKQNKQGEVLEVTMQRCSSDPLWQLSLAKAIQAASPLSAPPDTAVFTDIVTLDFDVSVNRQQSLIQ